MVTMEHVLIVTKDQDKITKWCETNTVKVFLDFIQYVLDSCNNPADFWIYVVDRNICVNLLDYATDHGMRKRTFHEKLKDNRTGSFQNIAQSFPAGFIRRVFLWRKLC